MAERAREGETRSRQAELRIAARIERMGVVIGPAGIIAELGADGQIIVHRPEGFGVDFDEALIKGRRRKAARGPERQHRRNAAEKPLLLIAGTAVIDGTEIKRQRTPMGRTPP